MIFAPLMQKEMDRLLMERSLIERELDCSQHDPIEVVLIFDKSNAAAAPSSDTTRLQKKKRKRTRPRPPSSAYSPAAGGGGQGKRPKRHKGGKKQKKKQQVNSAEVYYDPTKLKFVFSTPSPLSRKFLEMRDRTAVSGEEELSIYDMADMPLSTGSAGKRPLSSSDGPPPHAFQLGEDRRVQNETS